MSFVSLGKPKAGTPQERIARRAQWQFAGGMRVVAALLSMVLPSRRLAATVAGLVLVASFFLTALARLDEKLRDIARLLPLEYYQSGEAIAGLNWNWFVGLLGFALLVAVLAWWRFERRDIRVGGEGGWQIALPWRRVAPRTG